MKVDLSEDFKTKYRDLMGERAEKLFSAIENDSQEAFRLNPLKPDYKNVSYSLDNPIEYSPIGFFGNINGNSIDHLSGYVYSQEPSAMYVTEILNPTGNDKVLDLCAAPGSKTTYIASKMDSQGLLVSNEIKMIRGREFYPLISKEWELKIPLLLTIPLKTLKRNLITFLIRF